MSHHSVNIVFKKNQWFLYYSSHKGAVSYLYLEAQHQWLMLSMRAEDAVTFQIIEHHAHIGIRLLNRYTDRYQHMTPWIILLFVNNNKLSSIFTTLKSYQNQSSFIHMLHPDDLPSFFQEKECEEIEVLTD